MYEIIVKLIDNRRKRGIPTDDLTQKANKLYLYGQLTDKEYEDIMAQLVPQEDAAAEAAENTEG